MALQAVIDIWCKIQVIHYGELMGKKYLAPSVKKAFDIMRIISKSKDGIGLNEIARSLGIAKSTVHGITSILEEVGAVEREPVTKRYELGMALFELGRRAYSKMEIRQIARPFMEELMEKAQESVFLGTLSGDHSAIMVLDVVECEHDLKITSPIGSMLPIYAAASGKALLSVLDEKEAMEIIKTKGLPKRTEKSITDPAQFIEEIRKVRQKGYATDYEEYIAGVRAVAAPITVDKKHPASIYVVGFKASLDDEKMLILKEEIKRTSESINNSFKVH